MPFGAGEGGLGMAREVSSFCLVFCLVIELRFFLRLGRLGARAWAASTSLERAE